MEFNRGDRVVVYATSRGRVLRSFGTIVLTPCLEWLYIKMDKVITTPYIFAHPKQCRKLKKRTAKDVSSNYYYHLSKEPKQKASLAVGDIVKVVGEITKVHSVGNYHFCHIQTPNDRFVIAPSDVEKIGAMKKGLQIDPDGTVKKGSMFE